MFGGYLLGGAAALFSTIVLVFFSGHKKDIEVNLFGVEVTNGVMILIAPIVLFVAGYLFMFLFDLVSDSRQN